MGDLHSPFFTLNNDMNEKENFYNKCAEIMGTSHMYQQITHSRRRSNRWGPRNPGNGRFPGFGIIRWFGANFIQIALTNPVNVNQTFTSESSCLDFLRVCSSVVERSSV
jgi:hypothetical protein